MAQITLSEYLGFIFSEIARARAGADLVSKQIAIEYAADPILKEFSVPRFKVPEMDLTIPVIISGALYTNALKLNISLTDFNNIVTGKLNDLLLTLTIRKGGPGGGGGGGGGGGRPGNDLLTKLLPPASIKIVQEMISSFHQALSKENDLHDIDAIVLKTWDPIFDTVVDDSKLRDQYTKMFPNDELFNKSYLELLNKIKANVVVVSNKIQNLLVNPETNIVKNESTDATVFVVKAKVKEEGIFIKTVKDPDTNQEKQVVEFD